MKRILAVIAVALLAGVSGCKGSNAFIPGGVYSGSTADKQSVNIVVGSKITLDGAEMRFTKDQGLQGVHDKKLRMKCHTQNHQTELSCFIERDAHTETDELLKL